MAQTLSLVGSWMQSLSFPWVAYALSASPFWLGLASAVQFTPMLLLSLPAGAIVDKLDKRRVVLFTQISLSCLAMLMAVLLGSGVLSYPLLLVMAFTMGTLQALDFPARQAMVHSIIGQDHIANAVALNSSVFNAARLVGPALAGLVMVAWGPVWCFAINGLSYVPVIIVLALTKMPGTKELSTAPFAPGVDGQSAVAKDLVVAEESPGGGQSAGHERLVVETRSAKNVRLAGDAWSAAARILASIRAALAYVRGEVKLRRILINTAIMGIFGVNQMVILPVKIREHLGGGESSFSMLISAMGLGSFASAIFLATRGKKAPLAGLMPWFAVVSALALAVLSEVQSMRAAILIMILLGMGNVAFFTTANASLQHGSKFEFRGRVMAMYALVFGGLAPVGSLLTGSLMASWNSELALWVCAASIIVFMGLHALVEYRITEKTR